MGERKWERRWRIKEDKIKLKQGPTEANNKSVP